ncbi:MAG: hypothetical protein KKH02_06740 [Proteobacteria bacterium]|nr:hypothetical protein [Pseudomonadota bacterium]MBU1966160.1 hypothetical protein [Pseudomonadota bacterium]MBU4370609.1 hypothetical protein [Pseudomonadota bacterium]MBU4582091.1 hypothetical protein [Pseudomonadota bacterium]MCG2738613.1 hypothetical protein [Syntrophaceae bacterium]
MTPAGYTEDALIERPTIALLAELGWKTVPIHSTAAGKSCRSLKKMDEGGDISQLPEYIVC